MREHENTLILPSNEQLNDEIKRGRTAKLGGAVLQQHGPAMIDHTPSKLYRIEKPAATTPEQEGEAMVADNELAQRINLVSPALESIHFVDQEYPFDKLTALPETD